MVPWASSQPATSRASRDGQIAMHDGAVPPPQEPFKEPQPVPRTPTEISSFFSTPSDAVPAKQDGVSTPSFAARFMRDRPPLAPDGARSNSSSPFRLSMPLVSPGQLAFSAMQFLPVPVLILNNLKTVVLANEAMGRLLGMPVDEQDHLSDASYVIDRIRGQTLSQVGIDMLQDGKPVWVTWENFMDSLLVDLGAQQAQNASILATQTEGDGTPVPGAPEAGAVDAKVADRPSHTAVVDVVVSRQDFNKTTFDSEAKLRASDYQVHAKMIVSIWEIEDHQTYFTLTFTNSHTTAPPLPTRKSVARTHTVEAADRRSIAVSNAPSVSSSHDSSSPSFRASPSAISLSSSPFPPYGPPSKSSHSSTPSILQKMTMMKDALLDTTQTPILAMWKDGSVTFPNKAARVLFRTDSDFQRQVDGFDILPNWKVYTEDFTRELDPSEYPISVLVRTETPFSSRRVGMYNGDGQRVVYDVMGEAIRDEVTGEFLAGVVTCRDITKMTQMITQIKQADEERFKLICDTMPQLVWTTKPDGMHDFYNTRWYTYTGLSEEESLGMGWKNPFHPEDMPETSRRWRHSLATGEPYVTEYRCLSKEGHYRWFLGRALPFRNKETGKIEKWFGTCTDVHESIETKMAAKRTRQQLLSVLAHAQVTIFTVDVSKRVTMLEGALIWDATGENANSAENSPWYLGENVHDVFNRLDPMLPSGVRSGFLEPIENIIAGSSAEVVKEHGIDNRWFRTRFIPVHAKNTRGEDRVTDAKIEGVIGVIMDLTELRVRETALQRQEQEKRQLVANEAAAKEASRLKSQFLANMSHEIRTPITGVIGMAELMKDLELDDEQREYTENIYRSANALLTVINDILDFSKVESGRLDIEEVQFSLSVIIRDVGKMLSFAAERKSLDFQSDISVDIESDIIVMGDPGRVRQIITNLLTNSIKFTNQGYVKFSVQKEKETADSIEIKFVVEDSGIGIEDEVRKRLFQPFSQGDASTARRFGGTGLGLTICKNLLDLMHGRISLESTLGSGTTATFWIPFNKPQGPQSSGLVEIDSLPHRLQSDISVSCNSSEYEQIVPTPPTDLVQLALDKNKLPRRQISVSMSSPLLPQEDLSIEERAKTHILVVEDNAINQQIATKTIKKLGFSVAAAWNGKEALEYLEAAKRGNEKKPAIILMDVQMPVIDGYKTTHLLRHHVPYKMYAQDVPIVAMTASAIQGDKEKCRKAGMDDYLAKPVKSMTLERMLLRWARTRRPETLRADVSEASDCSAAGEHCSNTEIPAFGIPDFPKAPLSEDSVVMDKPSLLTPRPLVRNGPHEKSPFHLDSLPTPAEPEAIQSQVRRHETDELAMQLRDDKLIDAAGGAAVGHAHSLQTSASAGQALTEENVGKLEREARRVS